MDCGTIKIRLYGQSLHVFKIKFKPEYKFHFYKTADNLKQPIEKALLNIRFFDMLTLKEYQSLDDLKQCDVDSCIGGLINNGQDKIEIKNGRKRLEVLTIKQLVLQETLFPLYNVYKYGRRPPFENHIFLIEKEVGLIAEFHVAAKDFKIENLKFDIKDIRILNEEKQVLTNINYNNIALRSHKTNGLLTYRHCINKLP